MSRSPWPGSARGYPPAGLYPLRNPELSAVESVLNFGPLIVLSMAVGEGAVGAVQAARAATAIRASERTRARDIGKTPGWGAGRN